MLVRNLLYTKGLFKVHSFDVHTIGVGNLSMGGDGKSPMVEYLVSLCKENRLKPAVLSRGYRRETRGFVYAQPHHNSSTLGDEPYLFYSKYDISVAVDENRVRGMSKIVKMPGFDSEVIVLDDVYQHRSVNPGLLILVSDFQRPFYSDRVLPSGRLREFPEAANRADIIVFTKTPERITAMEMKSMIKDFKLLAHQKVFFCYTKYGELFHASNPKQTINTLKELCHLKVILFSGIANPEPMITYLSEYAVSVHPITYPDHHPYTLQDLEQIQKYFEAFTTQQKIIVTTEKDLMRLKNPAIWSRVSKMAIYVLPIYFSFKEKQAEFDDLIINYVRRTKPYADLLKK